MCSRWWTVGEAVGLDPRHVSEHAIARMRFQVNSLNLALPFDCALCGAERLGNFNDPGLLWLYSFTCADALGSKECKKAYLPRGMKREPYLLPGSLVWCSKEGKGTALWPAMVDYCPDGDKSYYMGEDEAGEKGAYFVVFLNDLEKSDYPWVGGFFSTKALEPFRNPKIPNNASAAYKRSLKIAKKASANRLTQRVNELSLIVFTAKLRGRPIQIDLMSIELDPEDEQESAPAQGAQGSMVQAMVKREDPERSGSGSRLPITSRLEHLVRVKRILPDNSD